MSSFKSVYQENPCSETKNFPHAAPYSLFSSTARREAILMEAQTSERENKALRALVWGLRAVGDLRTLRFGSTDLLSFKSVYPNLSVLQVGSEVFTILKCHRYRSVEPTPL